MCLCVCVFEWAWRQASVRRQWPCAVCARVCVTQCVSAKAIDTVCESKGQTHATNDSLRPAAPGAARWACEQRPDICQPYTSQTYANHTHMATIHICHRYFVVRVRGQSKLPSCTVATHPRDRGGGERERERERELTEGEEEGPALARKTQARVCDTVCVSKSTCV